MKIIKQIALGIALAIASYVFAIGMLLGITTILTSKAHASEIVFQFKNPSFSGIGAGAQWLTIENQEATRKKAIQDKIEAALKAEAQAEQNSILNKFMTNLESRIYSQLAKQLTDNLFGPNSVDSGTFELDGNTISFEKTLDGVTLRVVEPDGSVTSVTIPTTSFKF